MKIGICILTVPLDRLGGLSYKYGALIKGLAKQGHEVTVIQTKTSFNQSKQYFNSLSPLPVSPFQIQHNLSAGYRYWSSLVSLWSRPVLEDFPGQVDVLYVDDPLIHVPKNRTYRAIFAHNHFPPYIYEHLRMCGYRSLPMFLEIPFLNLILRKRLYDGYITETNGQKEWVNHNYSIPNHVVKSIPPGYDSNILQKVKDNDQEPQTSANTIIFSGRLNQWKGVFELLRAFSALVQDYSQWKLHFVGDGPAREDLQEFARKKSLQDKVVFWGRRSSEENYRLISQAGIFALPSYIESLPLSLIEAMALGIPSIASDVGGIREHLISNEETGLLTQPKDDRSLYCALEKLVANSAMRNKLGANGKIVAGPLTYEKMVESTAVFFDDFR